MERKIYVGHGVTTSLQDKSITYAIRRKKCWSVLSSPKSAYNWSQGKVRNFHPPYPRRALGIYMWSCLAARLIVLANAERRGARPTWDDEVYVGRQPLAFSLADIRSNAS